MGKRFKMKCKYGCFLIGEPETTSSGIKALALAVLTADGRKVDTTYNKPRTIMVSGDVVCIEVLPEEDYIKYMFD